MAGWPVRHHMVTSKTKRRRVAWTGDVTSAHRRRTRVVTGAKNNVPRVCGKVTKGAVRPGEMPDLTQFRPQFVKGITDLVHCLLLGSLAKVAMIHCVAADLV